jgi:hypothetical protein
VKEFDIFVPLRYNDTSPQDFEKAAHLRDQAEKPKR